MKKSELKIKLIQEYESVLPQFDKVLASILSKLNTTKTKEPAAPAN